MKPLLTWGRTGSRVQLPSEVGCPGSELAIAGDGAGQPVSPGVFFHRCGEKILFLLRMMSAGLRCVSCIGISGSGTAELYAPCNN